jgi:hypothetical protein
MSGTSKAFMYLLDETRTASDRVESPRMNRNATAVAAFPGRLQARDGPVGAEHLVVVHTDALRKAKHVKRWQASSLY